MGTLTDAIAKALKYWYLPLVAGILFVAFGVYIFTIPLEAYLTLAMLFSAAFFISGVGDIYFSIANKDALDGWGWYLVSGILTFLFGTFLVMNPGVSMVTLPFIVGFGLLFRSAQGLGFAMDLKKIGVSWGNLAFASVLGIILSFLLIVQPVFAAASIVTITALAIIVVGIYSIMLSLLLKKVKDVPSKFQA